MDVTVTSTIIWGVIWFVAGSALSAAIFWAVLGLGALVGTAFKGAEVGAVVSLPIAWVATIIWQIFVIIQVIIHIVTLVQLLTGTYVAS